MIFEIIRGGKNWLGGERMGRPIFSPGKEWAGPFFPRGKNWLGGNSGLLQWVSLNMYQIRQIGKRERERWAVKTLLFK